MKIIQRGVYTGDIIDTVLNNRGVWNRELFLNPDDSTDSPPEQLRNAQQGKELLLHHMTKGSKIDIIVDQDADGFMSSATMYQFLRYLDAGRDCDLGYILHEMKAHGLTDYIMSQILERRPNLVVIPDAGSNDVAQIEQLVNEDIDVLVIDHHNVSFFTDKGVIVNNQLCENTNTRLVGVGMVYKFIQLIDNEYGLDIVNTYLDLVAVGQIGDASDIADNEIRNLVHGGLDNIRNGFLRVAITEKNGLGTQLSPKDLSFGVIPIINAVTRVGTLDERDILFRALAHIDTDKVYPTVKKKKNRDTGKFENIEFQFDIFQHAYDTCVKCKARQDAAVKKMVEQIATTLVDDAGVIIAYTGNVENPGITGLIANKIMSKYDKPVLLLNEQEDTFTGSGRGHEKTIEDFREWCEKSQLVEFAQGHPNAFGICIRKDKLEAFKDYTRRIKKQGESVYEVDVLTNKPSKDDCETVEKNKRLFGGTVSEPLIGIVGLTVPKKFIGIRGSVLTIYSWGVSITQFNTSPEFYDEIFKYPEDTVRFNVVGTYGVNDWGGRKVLQLVAKDIEIVYNNQDEEVTVDSIVF